MAAIITNKLRIFNAQKFIESLSEQTPLWQSDGTYTEGNIVLYNSEIFVAVEDVTGASGFPTESSSNWSKIGTSIYNNLYLGIGKNSPWTDDSNPPTPADAVADHYTVKNDLLAIKKVGSDAITLALPRINWTSGTVYSMYDDRNPEEIIPNGYVLTEDANKYNIYKCINNSKYTDTTSGVSEVASTVKPSGTGTSLITTGDGYVWKYMYSIELQEALDFLTKDYIPVKFITEDPNTGDPGNSLQLQWAVQTTNTQGKIQLIKVDKDSADSSRSGGDGYLQNINQSGVTIPNSTTVSIQLDSAPADITTGAYNDYSLVVGSEISRIVSYSYTPSTSTMNLTLENPLTPSSDSSIIVAPSVQVTGDGTGCLAYAVTTGSHISRIEIVNGGSDYTTAAAIVLPIPSSGTECKIHAVLSPGSGHGYNPVEELGGYYVMTAVKLNYGEPDTRTTGDVDFTETVFPVAPADNPVFRQIVIVADPIDTSTSRIATNSTYRGPSHPRYADGNNKFDINAGTGKILYVENRQPVSRAVDQIEDIKVVFEF